MLTSGKSSTPVVEARYKFNMAYIWTISLVAALGGLLFGYDWVVIGGAKPFFERFFGIENNANLSGWANSCALFGCLIGAIISGALSDKFGRKKLLILAGFLFATTSIATALAPSFLLFIIFRILGGVAIGLASNLSPMYIAEVAPAQVRGALVGINQITINIGIVLAMAVNYYIGRGAPPLDSPTSVIVSSWWGQSGWRWMIAATAVPSLFFFVLAFFVPESPRWLAKKGLNDLSKKILTRIGGRDYAEATIAEIDNTLVNEVNKVDFRELLEPRLFKIVMLGVVLAVFQQWCGINTIFNYAEEIFRAAGIVSMSSVLFNIVLTGVVFLVATAVAITIVDRVGRKVLMLAGAAGLAITYTVLGAVFKAGIQGFVPVTLVLIAIICYAFSLAPVTWIILSEIFPNRIRGAAMSVSVSALWIACFVLTFGYKIAHSTFGAHGTFWLFAGICVLGFFYIKLKLPETKGKTLEEIEKELVD